jgi:PIN domain nuclease of toxin-antitoxin system
LCLCRSAAVTVKSRALWWGPRRDPFDHMLMAQATIEGMSLMSNEAPFDAYDVRRLR